MRNQAPQICEHILWDVLYCKVCQSIQRHQRPRIDIDQTVIQPQGGESISYRYRSEGLYQYRESHCGDKTILRPSYLHNVISYTGKTAFHIEPGPCGLVCGMDFVSRMGEDLVHEWSSRGPSGSWGRSLHERWMQKSVGNENPSLPHLCGSARGEWCL